MKMRERSFPYLLLIPAIFVLGVVLVYPVVQSVIWSFFSMNFKRPATMNNFVGFFHYTKAFESGDFWNAIVNTVEYTVLGAGGAFLLGLSTAVLLNEDFRGRSFIRALTISPWPIPYVVGCLIWMWILDKQFGIANHVLKSLGLIKSNVGWLHAPGMAMASVVGATIWKEFPFATIMLLAGLQNIPPEQYEQGQIDGANFLQIFWHITLPNLRSVTTIVWLLLIIWIFKRFTIIYVMTAGGPSGSTETLIIRTYLSAFKYLRFGRASALAAIMLLVVLIFTAVYLMRQEKRRV